MSGWARPVIIGRLGGCARRRDRPRCFRSYASTVRNSDAGARSLRHELIGWLVSA
jgi:hypothetical protein